MKTVSKTLLIIAAAALLPFQAMAAEDAAPHKGKGMHKGGFADRDTNGDGVLTMDEWLAGAKKIFAEQDTNGDGKITKEERMAQREMRKERRQEAKKRHEERMKEREAAPSAGKPKE